MQTDVCPLPFSPPQTLRVNAEPSWAAIQVPGGANTTLRVHFSTHGVNLNQTVTPDYTRWLCVVDSVPIAIDQHSWVSGVTLELGYAGVAPAVDAFITFLGAAPELIDLDGYTCFGPVQMQWF